MIAAAFIGPGTVTTAASSGSRHGYTLAWALVFSTAACLVLQEAAARLTVVSGRNLGQALRASSGRGVAGAALLVLVLGAIVAGCAAYQAGNILGGVAGIQLETGGGPTLPTLAVGLFAGALLWIGTPRGVGRALSLFVAVMGAAFLWTALRLQPPLAEVARGGLLPSMPTGSGMLVLGLIGTTVVPYNLFLGSGLARGQSLGELRFGLSVSVVAGGAISIGILVVGAAVDGPFSFEALARLLGQRLGSWAPSLFAVGLFAAGASSAVTAPLAAAVTARSLLATSDADARWNPRSWRFRGVWLGVLAVGVVFGLAAVRPVPAILAAQALNGLLLPIVAVFLLLAVNDRKLMGPRGLNRPWANTLLIAVVAVSVMLGSAQSIRALSAAAGLGPPPESLPLAAALISILLCAVPVARALRSRRG